MAKGLKIAGVILLTSGIIGCEQEVDYNKLKSSADWGEGTKVVVQYMCTGI